MTHYVEIVPGIAPNGYEDGFTTDELAKVDRRFNFHPERHILLLYGDIAETLNDGSVIACPLGEDRLDYPFGIRFKFENVYFMALCRQPRSIGTKVIICPDSRIVDRMAIRVAHVFTDHFMIEYRKLYSASIRDSKIRSGISVKE